MGLSTNSTNARTASSSMLLSGEPLERRLEELLHQERFDAAHALRRPRHGSDPRLSYQAMAKWAC